MSLNRKHNAHNPNQGSYKKVLCVCSAGLLRSPTAALVLANEPFNYNTRACGIETGHALIPLDDVLIEWADEIVCMDAYQASYVQAQTLNKPVICLNIGDSYGYRDPELMARIKIRYCKWLESSAKNAS